MYVLLANGIQQYEEMVEYVFPIVEHLPIDYREVEGHDMIEVYF